MTENINLLIVEDGSIIVLVSRIFEHKTDRCMKDFWASLSRSAILSSKFLAVPFPSP